MLAGVDFSDREAAADLGRLERFRLDAGRRGVPGTGFMSLRLCHFPLYGCRFACRGELGALT